MNPPEARLIADAIKQLAAAIERAGSNIAKAIKDHAATTRR